jgi:hypothetical protein
VILAWRWGMATAAVALCTATAGAALVTPAGAEIIYAHGGDPGAELIAMNDDGSGAHTLLTPGQIPGSPIMINLAEPNVFPGGSTLAFQAETGAFIQVGGPAGDCGVNCAATYTLSSGAITRLAEPPLPSPTASSGEHFPVVTADGRVVSEELGFAYECHASCEVRGSTPSLIARPIGGGATTPWIRPENSLSPFSADPANGGLLGYVWSHSPNDILVVANSEEKEFILITAPHGSAPAFSTTGEQIAYINEEVGAGAGLYVVAAKEAATPKEVLKDPAPPKFSSEAGSFHQLTWAGPNIVFSAVVGGVQNIYSLAAHCVTDLSPCTMGADATQLTSDATSKAPDQFPTWTSASVTGPATGGGGTPGGGGTSGGGGTTGGATGGGPTSGASSVTHAKVKARGVAVTVACAGAAGSTCVDSLTLSVLETLRSGKLVAVAARTTKRTVTLGRSFVTVAAGQTKSVTISLNGAGKALLKSRHTLHVKLILAQSSAGKTNVVKTITLAFTQPRSAHH